MALTLAFTVSLQGCGTSEISGVRGLQECTGSVNEGVMERVCERECRLGGFNHGGWCRLVHDNLNPSHDRNLCECIREIVTLTKIYEEACIASPCTITRYNGRQEIQPYTCTIDNKTFCGKGPDAPDRDDRFWLRNLQGHAQTTCWTWREGALVTKPHFCLLPEVIPHGCERS